MMWPVTLRSLLGNIAKSAIEAHPNCNPPFLASVLDNFRTRVSGRWKDGPDESISLGRRQLTQLLNLHFFSLHNVKGWQEPEHEFLRQGNGISAFELERSIIAGVIRDARQLEKSIPETCDADSL